MNSYERFTDGSKVPSEREILLGIGKGLSHWRELQAWIARGMNSCAQCPDCGCEQFESRTVTRAWVEQRIGALIPPEDYRRFVLPYERRDFPIQPLPKLPKL